MKGYNIRFPIKDDSEKNTFLMLNKTTKDAFSSDLLLLLLTEKGERYYDPNYGTNLVKFIFEPNDLLTENDIEEDIKKTISTYIPNLKINNIEFNRLYDDNNLQISENQLNVKIKFTYSEDTFNENGEIDINF